MKKDEKAEDEGQRPDGTKAGNPKHPEAEGATAKTGSRVAPTGAKQNRSSSLFDRSKVEVKRSRKTSRTSETTSATGPASTKQSGHPASSPVAVPLQSGNLNSPSEKSSSSDTAAVELRKDGAPNGKARSEPYATSSKAGEKPKSGDASSSVWAEGQNRSIVAGGPVSLTDAAMTPKPEPQELSKPALPPLEPLPQPDSPPQSVATPGGGNGGPVAAEAKPAVRHGTAPPSVAPQETASKSAGQTSALPNAVLPTVKAGTPDTVKPGAPRSPVDHSPAAKTVKAAAPVSPPVASAALSGGKASPQPVVTPTASTAAGTTKFVSQQAPAAFAVASGGKGDGAVRKPLANFSADAGKLAQPQSPALDTPSNGPPAPQLPAASTPSAPKPGKPASEAPANAAPTSNAGATPTATEKKIVAPAKSDQAQSPETKKSDNKTLVSYTLAQPVDAMRRPAVSANSSGNAAPETNNAPSSAASNVASETASNGLKASASREINQTSSRVENTAQTKVEAPPLSPHSSEESAKPETVKLEAPGQAPSQPAPTRSNSEGAARSNKNDNGKPGGGGGGGPSEPLERRSGDKEFREVLTKALDSCRRNLIVVGIFSFVVNMLVLAIPIYLFNLSDRVYTSRSIDTLVMLTIVVVGAILAHTLLDMMRRFILMRVAVEAESKLGAPVLSAAAKASQNGSIREFQILGELQQLRNFITGPVLLTMLDAPAAPIYLVAVFLVHPELGYIVSLTSALLLVLALINQKVTAVPFARANAYATRATLQADAMARNAQVINAMGMIPEGVQMWGKETAESLTAQVIAQDRNIILAGISRFIRLLTQIAILGWGAYLSLNAELTGGMVIAASIVGSRALAPVEGTIEGWRSFIQARTAYTRIKTLLQGSALNLERLRLPRPQGRVNVERVLYVPPPNKKVILNGISFKLDPGESLAIVGPSGSGKSTLARMLVGSIAPTAGSIRLDMMDLRNWDTRQFGESVGYLPQDVQLFPATIKANIARMRDDATDAAIFEAADMADVHEMISQFAQGYETQVAIDGSPLSGGQKQRIGLARAFFGDPRLIVLDEPNSNLDTPGEIALANSLTRAKAKGITVVTITQRPALLKSVDNIMIINNGTVQEFGPRDKIIPIVTGRRMPEGSGPRALDGGLSMSDA